MTKVSGMILNVTNRVVLSLMTIACLSCLPRPEISEVSEKGSILMRASTPLKGGHLDLRIDNLIRSYSITPWFQGAGGQPTIYIDHYYLILDGAVRSSKNRTRMFKWIGPYTTGSPSFIRPNKLVIAGADTFMQYTVVMKLSPSECKGLVKYGKYTGRRFRFLNSDMPFFIYPSTYKWPYEYVWEDVAKEAFDRADSRGDVINLEEKYLGSGICTSSRREEECSRSCKEMLFPWKPEEHFHTDVSSFNFDKVEKTLHEHPEFARKEGTRNVLHSMMRYLRPEVRERYGEKARKMLALLYRFDFDVNGVDYHSSTPLQVAIEVDVEPDIVNELIRRGARVLYPPCGFRSILAAKHPELATGDLTREIGEEEGWVGDDVYQIWMDEQGSQQKNEIAARKKLLRHFGLSQSFWDKASGEAGGKLHTLLAYQVNVPSGEGCSRTDPKTGTKQWFVRLAYPGLQNLLKEHQEFAAMRFPVPYPFDTVW